MVLDGRYPVYDNLLDGRQGADSMITLDLPAARFNYRVAGIAMHDGHVLLHRAETEDFWSLPGGRCEIMEPSAHAIVREMREECAEMVMVERLVWLVEYFFTYAGRPHHELGLYYLIGLPVGSPLLNVRATFRGDEAGTPLLFQWFPVAATERLRTYPAFLRTSLQSIPSTLQHVTYHDKDDDAYRAITV